jgi:hypothetical protein
MEAVCKIIPWIEDVRMSVFEKKWYLRKGDDAIFALSRRIAQASCIPIPARAKILQCIIQRINQVPLQDQKSRMYVPSLNARGPEDSERIPRVLRLLWSLALKHPLMEKTIKDVPTEHLNGKQRRNRRYHKLHNLKSSIVWSAERSFNLCQDKLFLLFH